MEPMKELRIRAQMEDIKAQAFEEGEAKGSKDTAKMALVLIETQKQEIESLKARISELEAEAENMISKDDIGDYVACKRMM